MRSRAMLFLLLIGTPAILGQGAATPPPAGGGDLRGTLVALEKRSWQAWQDRDGKFFEGFLSDDHVDVHGSGPAGKKAVVAGVSSPACVVRSFEVRDFRLTRVAPDAALLVYRAEQDTTCGGRAVPSPSWVTSLYVLRDGRWQNALFQVTDAPAGH